MCSQHQDRFCVCLVHFSDWWGCSGFVYLSFCWAGWAVLLGIQGAQRLSPPPAPVPFLFPASVTPPGTLMGSV